MGNDSEQVNVNLKMIDIGNWRGRYQNEKRLEHKKKSEVYWVCNQIEGFMKICENHSINCKNRYSCMKSLYEKVKTCKNRINTGDREDFLRILLGILYSDSNVFQQSDCWCNGRLTLDQDDDEYENILYGEKSIASMAKHLEEQKLIAFKLEYLHKTFDRLGRKTSEDKKSPNAESDKSRYLADSLLTILKYYLYVHSKKTPENELSDVEKLPVREIEKELGRYEEALQLIEENLHTFLEDACFIEILPFFLFYHLAIAEGLLASTNQAKLDSFLVWGEPLSIFTANMDGYYLNRTPPWTSTGFYEKEQFESLFKKALDLYDLVYDCCESVFECLQCPTKRMP